ncbi:MAG: ABC transporter permease subunit [Rhizobiales bacterium]|nr:ABC transporter permease subunit [Hyphomicrobiales bacterium]
MLAYVIRRVAGTIPVIILISLLVFMLVQAAPGDPADLLLSDEATAEDVADARARWGLDQPVWVQYWKFLTAALQGDLGTSFRYADPVLTMIAERLPATIELAVVSIIIAVVIAVPLGVWAGARPNSWIDNLGSLVGLFGISMPNFWFGIMLILVMSGILNLLPSSGRDTYGIAGDPITGFYLLDSVIKGNWRGLWDGLAHIAMPAIALGTNMMGILMRVTRSSVMEVMHEEYVTTARAKGVSERAVLWHHVVRNALVPIVTVVGLELGTLLSGSIIVETVFSWPGSGQLLISAITSRDYPLITGTVLTYTMAFVIINFTVDILYAAIDPRIRFDK